MEETDTVTTRDDALVLRAQAGDARAFEALYRAHVGRVYAICLRMTADENRAAELTQDAFVKAWQRLGSFRGESAFGSWLYRVAVNTVLGARRTDRRRQDRIRATDDLTRFDGPETTSAPGTTIDLEKALATLPEKARAVLVLYDLEGYKHHEIADLMGIAAGTSKAHLHRARQLLKRFLNR